MSSNIPLKPLQDYVMAEIVISDTNTHNYLTDPYNPNTGFGIRLLPLGYQVPKIQQWSVFVYNNANQQASVQLLGAKEGFTQTPFTIGSSVSVNAGSTALIVPTPNPFPTPQISIQFSYTTAPTGFVDITKPYSIIAILIISR